MPSAEVYEELRHIAQTEFRDVVTLAAIAQLESGVPRKLRLRILDGSYVDIFVSPSGRYSYHWERTVGDTKFVYRHDNAPHAAWKHVTTFPKHFHDGTEDYVVASYISSEPQQALREFCRFIRSVLRTQFSAS
jgi:hypothetical protein